MWFLSFWLLMLTVRNPRTRETPESLMLHTYLLWSRHWRELTSLFYWCMRTSFILRPYVHSHRNTGTTTPQKTAVKTRIIHSSSDPLPLLLGPVLDRLRWTGVSIVELILWIGPPCRTFCISEALPLSNADWEHPRFEGECIHLYMCALWTGILLKKPEIKTTVGVVGGGLEAISATYGGKQVHS